MYLTPEESEIKALQNNRDGWGFEEVKKVNPLPYATKDEDWADADEEEGY
jgi:hypothetical protein